MTAKRLFWIDIGTKAALVVLLLHGVAFSDLAQYHGTSTGVRLVTYPIAIVVVPLVWLFVPRTHRPEPYEYVIDICIAAPFLLDTLSNVLDLYETTTWWHDAVHVGTALPTALALGLVLRYRVRLGRLPVAGVAAAVVVVGHVVWSVAADGADATRNLVPATIGAAAGAILAVAVRWQAAPAPENSVAAPETLPLD